MRFWNMATVMALKPGTGAPSRSLLTPTTTTVPALRMAPKACPMCSFLTMPMLTIAESSGTSPAEDQPEMVRRWHRDQDRAGQALPGLGPGHGLQRALGFALGEHHDA